MTYQDKIRTYKSTVKSKKARSEASELFLKVLLNQDQALIEDPNSAMRSILSNQMVFGSSSVSS